MIVGKIHLPELTATQLMLCQKDVLVLVTFWRKLNEFSKLLLLHSLFFINYNTVLKFKGFWGFGEIGRAHV